MDFNQSVGGRTLDSGIWVPGRGQVEEKADRTQTGLTPKPSSVYSGILSGGSESANRFGDLSSYLRTVKSIPWVWACVSVIAYTFANNEYQYLDKDGKEITDQFDPFLRLWAKPNPTTTGFQWRELLMFYFILAGEAFISLEEWDANDTPHEMYLPNPARMRVVQSKRSGEIIGYEYDPGGTFTSASGARWTGMIPYEPFEIIHLKSANPLDELRGLGAIEALEPTLNIVAEMTGTELSYWKSGGRITGVLQTDQQVDDLTFEKLVNRWREFTATGRDRSRFKTAILEQGLKYQPIAEGLRGIDMTKLENSKRDVVTAALGVPLQKLGIFTADTGYKADDADRFFYGETMEPIFTRTEDGLAQPLVDIFDPDNLFRFARRNYEDDTVKLNNAKIMQSLMFTFGELCDYLGVDPPTDIRKDMIVPMPGATPLTLAQLGSVGQAAVEHPMAPPPPPPKPPPPPAISGGPPIPGLPPGSKPPGQTPLRGTQPSATGTENGRSGKVDANGHLPNSPQTIVKHLEAKDFLTTDEERALRAFYEEAVITARAVKSQFRRPTEAKGLLRLNAVKATLETGVTVRPPRRAAWLPGTGEMVRRATASIRSRMVPRHQPKIQAALNAQNEALTLHLPDAIPFFRTVAADTGLTDEEKVAARQAWLRNRWDPAPLAEAVRELHVEAANDGWHLGKRSLGFGKDTIWERKADDLGAESLVSDVLSSRYDRLAERRIEGMDDTTIAQVEDIVSEGVRRGYSAMQIANGVATENFPGVSSVFTGAPTWATDPEAMPGFEYRSELIARTESMFAANWGSTTALLDSGISRVEAMDGSTDPECAERDGQIFDLDPDTGRPVDDDGEVVEDHPNGTLAWAPVVDITPVETGALDNTGDVTSYDAEESFTEGWETKEDQTLTNLEWEAKYGTGQANNPDGLNQWAQATGATGSLTAAPTPAAGATPRGGKVPPAPKTKPTGTLGSRRRTRTGHHRRPGIRHTHASGLVHSHRGGAINHSHGGAAKKSVGEIGFKYSEDQPRDDHGRFGSGGAAVAAAETPTPASGVATLHQVAIGMQQTREYTDFQVNALEQKLLALQAKADADDNRESKSVMLLHIGTIVAGTAVATVMVMAASPLMLAAAVGASIPIGSELVEYHREISGRIGVDLGRMRDWVGGLLHGDKSAGEDRVVKALVQGMVQGGLDSASANLAANGMVRLALESAKAQGVKPGLAEISDADLQKLLQSIFVGDQPQLKGVPIPGSPADSMAKDAKGEVDLGAASRDYLDAQGYAESADQLRAFAHTMGIPQISAKSLTALEYRSAIVAISNYAEEIKAVGAVFGEPILASDLSFTAEVKAPSPQVVERIIERIAPDPIPAPPPAASPIEVHFDKGAFEIHLPEQAPSQPPGDLEVTDSEGRTTIIRRKQP